MARLLRNFIHIEDTYAEPVAPSMGSKLEEPARHSYARVVQRGSKSHWPSLERVVKHPASRRGRSIRLTAPEAQGCFRAGNSVSGASARTRPSGYFLGTTSQAGCSVMTKWGVWFALIAALAIYGCDTDNGGNLGDGGTAVTAAALVTWAAIGGGGLACGGIGGAGGAAGTGGVGGEAGTGGSGRRGCTDGWAASWDGGVGGSRHGRHRPVPVAWAAWRCRWHGRHGGAGRHGRHGRLPEAWAAWPVPEAWAAQAVCPLWRLAAWTCC